MASAAKHEHVSPKSSLNAFQRACLVSQKHNLIQANGEETRDHSRNGTESHQHSNKCKLIKCESFSSIRDNGKEDAADHIYTEDAYFAQKPKNQTKKEW